MIFEALMEHLSEKFDVKIHFFHNDRLQFFYKNFLIKDILVNNIDLSDPNCISKIELDITNTLGEFKESVDSFMFKYNGRIIIDCTFNVNSIIVNQKLSYDGIKFCSFSLCNNHLSFLISNLTEMNILKALGDIKTNSLSSLKNILAERKQKQIKKDILKEIDEVLSRYPNPMDLMQKAIVESDANIPAGSFTETDRLTLEQKLNSSVEK